MAPRTREKELRRFLQVVVCVMGLGGGFVIELAPPAFPFQSGPLAAKFGHGILVMVVLVLYLIVVAQVGTRNEGIRDTASSEVRLRLRRGIGSAIGGSILAVVYAMLYSGLVVTKVGEGKYLAGLWRSPSWMNIVNSVSELEGFGGRIPNQALFERIIIQIHYPSIWSPGSRIASYLVLEFTYVIAFLLLYGAIFLIWEGCIRKSHGNSVSGRVMGKRGRN